MKKEENNSKKELTFREKLKDKRERAKIELLVYGIFFVVVLIFAKVVGYINNNREPIVDGTNSFIYSIKDNYEYHIEITIEENKYKYYGKVLGNNKTINLETKDEIKSYYQMNDKIYILDNDNYILTDIEEVYPYINYRYLDIRNIKEYIRISTKENDLYKIKISDLILKNNSNEHVTIYVEEGDKNIVIDYTELLKITEDNIEKATVNITYSNIDNIISLEE